MARCVVPFRQTVEISYNRSSKHGTRLNPFQASVVEVFRAFLVALVAVAATETLGFDSYIASVPQRMASVICVRWSSCYQSLAMRVIVYLVVCVCVQSVFYQQGISKSNL